MPADRTIRPSVAAAILAIAALPPAALLPALWSALWPSPAGAAETRPLPRFVALRFDTVNVRTGPGRKYPIRWVYKRKGLPVEISREVYNWRLIRDVRGDRGWIHVSNLTSRRSALTRSKRQVMRAKPAGDAKAVAILTADVIVSLQRCDGPWCTVRVGGYSGWLPRSSLWGVYPTETFE